jgi:ABC-2 type transport system ATP-binding protein
MIDTVDKSMYSETMPKQYRIGFADENEYQNFIDEKSFEIVKKNDKYRHVYISVADNEVTKLFGMLKNYDIRYIKYNPYSLEMYYTEVIEKGGKL